jgi:hypothetical protein
MAHWKRDAYGESLEIQIVMNSPKVLIARWEKTLSNEFYVTLVVIIVASISLISFLIKRARSRPRLPPPPPSPPPRLS